MIKQRCEYHVADSGRRKDASKLFRHFFGLLLTNKKIRCIFGQNLTNE